MSEEAAAKDATNAQQQPPTPEGLVEFWNGERELMTRTVMEARTVSIDGNPALIVAVDIVTTMHVRKPSGKTSRVVETIHLEPGQIITVAFPPHHSSVMSDTAREILHNHDLIRELLPDLMAADLAEGCVDGAPESEATPAAPEPVEA